MGSQPSPLDKGISNGNRYITKTINKPAHIRFHSKRPHSITKMIDNINLYITIAGSMNARS